MRNWIEDEKARRVSKSIPKFRPEDHIDADERSLELIQDIFDSCPWFEEKEDQVSILDFFVKIRKDPQIKWILTAVAWEPEGMSKLPKETF